MFEVTQLLLEENELQDVSAFGGGTALAAYYWDHKYSTDIDIFIYDKKHLLKDSNWTEKIKKLWRVLDIKEGLLTI